MEPLFHSKKKSDGISSKGIDVATPADNSGTKMYIVQHFSQSMLYSQLCGDNTIKSVLEFLSSTPSIGGSHSSVVNIKLPDVHENEVGKSAATNMFSPITNLNNDVGNNLVETHLLGIISTMDRHRKTILIRYIPFDNCIIQQSSQRSRHSGR